MQSLTIQEFRTLIDKIANLADLNGIDYKLPFSDNGLGYILGFESYRGDLMLYEGNVIFSEDCSESWSTYYPKYYDSLDELVDALWGCISGT